MNDIKQLEERIAQLTELVKTGSEAIRNMETALKVAEEERDRLADQRRESEPKFERVEGSVYCSVGITTFPNANGQSINVVVRSDDGHADDIYNYVNNNYFKTMQRAEEVADKINLLLKLERLHDIFCPDYVPNWSDGCLKHSVYFNVARGRYACSWTTNSKDEVYVYFPTEEIAQKVCDILNAERNEIND